MPRRAEGKHCESSTLTQGAKKTDVAEHPEVFRNIGLLFNWPLGAAKLPFN